MIITENQLDEWVRGNNRLAQGLVVELVFRLVAASCRKPRDLRFPLGDSINQRGPDGMLETDVDFEPFVPIGRSFWEIGTGLRAGEKATGDFRNRTDETPEEVRRESTFIFVTPLSGRRDWEYTWKEDAQATWLEERLRLNQWKDVRVIDGTRLTDWFHRFFAVERWLAGKMGLLTPKQIHQIEIPEERWDCLKNIGSPPELIPDIFLISREAASSKLREIFEGTITQLKIDSYYPGQMADFVAAFIESMDGESKIDIVGRCLIVLSHDAMNETIYFHEPHILIADFDFDETDTAVIRLLERARRSNHSVIYQGSPGGIPHPNRAPLPNPGQYQMQEALEKAGFRRERARTLGQRSNGNLDFLLRLLQKLSLMPEWAQESTAAELAVAEFIGAWNEQSEADKRVAEELSGKAYGEWIGIIREIALRPTTPLTHRDGSWKFIARFEGWYALGPRLFDEHLDRMRGIAANVLRELDPKFELPPDERYAASVHGKLLAHSKLIRKGLAESLALLGSHPKALTSCSPGKAETIAVLAVREILSDADWVLWASLNDLLPLLAEAAPEEFLNAVERALNEDPCPFKLIFQQEGSGVFGSNYLTGLLWALETLAWDTNLLAQVVLALGELAVIDPGGKWANRPSNSLSTIFLPWYPQTCAPVSKRIIVIETLVSELPEVGWELLLSLLPHPHGMTTGSSKPIWREIIPDDWSDGSSHQEYIEQVDAYAELALRTAKDDTGKLAELIKRLDDLPPTTRNNLMAFLESNSVASIPEAERSMLWRELIDLATKHRKFEDANWAMKPEDINVIEEVAAKIAPHSPIYYHQRLFSERDFDLYEVKSDFEEQRKILEGRREKAVIEIFEAGGIEMVLDFTKMVESPWRVGMAFGVVASSEAESVLLPALLEAEDISLKEFIGGFIRGRFISYQFDWVDRVDTHLWNPPQKGQFFALLPFKLETWERVAQLMRENESPYWSTTSTNPYEADHGLEIAVDHLIDHGRPHAAIICLQGLLDKKQPLSIDQTMRVLKAVLQSKEDLLSIDVHAITEVIKALQEDPDAKPDDILQVEWAFLPLLGEHHDASPKFLERLLASEPAFFCYVIRTVFRSSADEMNDEELTEHQNNVAKNGYQLLTNWKTPPGSKEDGTYSAEELTDWLQKVKESCHESGHLGVALSIVGQVLSYAPPDPDGLWIHHSVAEELNARDAGDMRDGFETALYNARGVFTWTAGKEERKLAAEYNARADDVDSCGYNRLAGTIRRLASFYEHEADEQESREDYWD